MTIYDAQGNEFLAVTPDDTSYRHREVMGEDTLVLKFSLAEHAEIPVGATCDFQGETYTLARPEALTMQHSREFDYTVTMEGPQWRAGIWKFRNTSDGRVKFSLTARPSEHLQMFVDNMNDREGGWTAGECIDHDEVCVCYDHAYCIEALGQMAEAFGTEWEIDGAGRVVHLHRVEYYRDDPLPLSYGRDNGLKPGVGRSNSSDTPPVEVLYAQGGTDNIDAGKYPQETHAEGEYPSDVERPTHSSELLLPPGRKIGYDGEEFFYEGDDGWDGEDVRHYAVDGQGYSVRRSDKDLETMAEDSLDCSEIYPKRVGEVTEVREVENTGGDVPFIDFIDAGIPEGLDYSECLIEGETMTVVFQSGNLAGREFDVNYIHSERRFEVVQDEIDGVVMPQADGAFSVNVGDRYAVFNCMLPSSYICDDADHSGAEWDMLRECVRYFHDNEEQKFTFTGKMDGIWSRGDWENIGGRVRPGAFVLFSDPRFQPEGEPVRIVGVKDFVNSPHAPELELSNETVTPGFASTVKDIESREMLVEERYSSALQFTKRRFRDAQETMAMLERAIDGFSASFTSSVTPITVQTMQMLVGDESLQFRFVTGFGSGTAVSHSVTYSASARTLTADAGYLQHLTLGVTDITDARDPADYPCWQLPAFTSAYLDDPDRGYYLYARCVRDGTEGEFRLSEDPVGMEEVSGYYHFLVGILNAEYEGDRSFVTLYGYTEVLPGRITTDRIVSSDGRTYFDLVNSVISGRITFINSSGGTSDLAGTVTSQEEAMEKVSGYIEAQGDFLDTTLSKILYDLTEEGLIDGQVETWFTESDPSAEWTAIPIQASHVGDIWYDPGSDRLWVWYPGDGGGYGWREVEDADSVATYRATYEAMEAAGAAAAGKRNVFLGEPVPPYYVGDLWLDGESILACVMARGEGEEFSADDWSDGFVAYDCTQTVIDGGLVTTGTVQLAGRDGGLCAGITGAGTDDGSVRIWAGSEADGKDTAPFRVTQDGSLYAESGTFAGFLRVPFHTLTSDDFADGAYALDREYCNLILPRTTDATRTVKLPYEGDDPSLNSGLEYNLFINYQKTESYNDTLVVDANGGLIHWYAQGVSLLEAMLSRITFHGGFVQLINIGGNEWIVSINNSVEVEWSQSDIVQDQSYLTLNPVSLTFTADGGSERVAVTSSDEWTVYSKPDWITVSQTSGGKAGTDTASSVRVTAAARGTRDYDTRTGEVTFQTASRSSELRVTQAGATRWYTLTINIGFGSTASVSETRPTPTLTVTADGATQFPRLTETGDDFYSWSGEYEEGTEVSYRVEASGYITRSGVVTMTGDTEVTVTLNADSTHLL